MLLQPDFTGFVVNRAFALWRRRTLSTCAGTHCEMEDRIRVGSLKELEGSFKIRPRALIGSSVFTAFATQLTSSQHTIDTVNPANNFMI